MKTLILVIALATATLTSNAYANDNLAAIMKHMGADWKTIATQISDATKNASTIATVNDLIQQINLAKQETPDTVASGAQTEADFQAQLTGVQTTATQLLAALQAGDNATAVGLLSTIKTAKDNGHNQFDPQN